MLKYLGFIIIFLTSLLLGYIHFKKFSNRVNFLIRYSQFINYIEAEILYSSDIIIDLIKKYSINDSLNNFLIYFIDKLKSGFTVKNAWKIALNDIKDFSGLTGDDIMLIENFGSTFGNSDIDSQVSYCKMNKKLIDSQINVALENKEKKGKLYFTLYMLGGISIILFFI